MESKLNAQLGTGGIVTATIQLEADQVLIVERRYDGASNPMKVFYRESGNSFKGNLGELFPILAYSQTEALEIAKDNSAQLRLIDGLLDLASIDARVSAIRTELRTLDVNVAACSLAEDEIDGRQRALATNEEKIAQLDKSLASAEHLVLQQLKPKTDCFTKIDRFVEEIEEAVEGISESIGGCSLPKLPKDFESDSELQTLLSDLDADAKKLKANAKVLESAVTKLAKKARSAALSWDDVVAKKRKQYEEWVRAQGGDKTALLTQKDRLEKERTALRKAVHTLQKQIDGVPKLKTARDQLLVELASESSRRFELRRRKYEELTLASGGRLDLQITASANRSDYLDELTVLKTGSHLQDATIRSVCDTVLPAELVALVLQNDGSTLAKRASITTALANKLVGHLVAHADRRRILALEHEDIVHDGPVIRYRKDDGNFYDLAQLSIGQKCTALLIIALAEGTRPIVIDQPEDALDITSVYQDVTLQIRERKSNRQFILTTHNPTVAVASDTDRYHVLTASASQALLATHGAMDRPVVKDAVIQHLEGGTASFSLKTRKYGMKIS
ncbi:MAG: hypothetical protein JWO05_42 [Gemmatimonadetes bacterium]|nr:hypothetical protein [Gemmatimonadota bacterium]